MAYGIADGKRRWVGPARGGGYSSPQRLTIDGVVQVVLLSDAGATGVAPFDGAVLWEHAWKGDAIVSRPAWTTRPALEHDSTAGAGVGIRRLAVARAPGGWTAAERWTSTGLKPYFNDFVVHKGHAYGFDGSILSCIDLEDGQRKWKGGRYGNGQLILLADQDLLRSFRKTANWRWSGPRRTSSRNSPGSRLSKARPGTTPCCRRHPARPQRGGDGGVPAVAREPLTGRPPARRGSEDPRYADHAHNGWRSRGRRGPGRREGRLARSAERPPSREALRRASPKPRAVLAGGRRREPADEPGHD